MSNRVESEMSVFLHAAGGRQDYVKGDGTVAGFELGAKLIDSGPLAEGTWKFQLIAGGAERLRALLRMSAHTGASVPTARLYATEIDGVTLVGTPVDFDPLADGTTVPALLDTLIGETYVILEITVAAGCTATFSKAEYSAL